MGRGSVQLGNDAVELGDIFLRHSAGAFGIVIGDLNGQDSTFAVNRNVRLVRQLFSGVDPTLHAVNAAQIEFFNQVILYRAALQNPGE